MKYNIQNIARKLEGEIFGNKDLKVTKLAPILQAEKDEMTFIIDKKNMNFINRTNSEVIIVNSVKDLPKNKTYILVETDIRKLLPQLMEFFKPCLKPFEKIIENSANIGNDVNIGKTAYIGHDVVIDIGTKIFPNVTILQGCKIGKNCIIYPNVTIREYTKIGDNVIIQPGVVLGSDGFGYVKIDSKHIKINQIGSVIVENDVEIGANCTIDRGTIGDTIIKKGTKIDNLVHIAHNDIIGKNCIIIAQSGISGSVTIEDNVTIAGQVGIAGHLKIGRNAIIGAKSGVTNDVKENSIMSGFPLKSHSEELKLKVYYSKLPGMNKKINQIEKRLMEIENVEKKV